MRKLRHDELVEIQNRGAGAERVPLTVVLNNIRSLYNVGGIFRTADGAGAEKLWLCGITGIPPHPRIAKTALDAQNSVPWEYREDPVSCLREMKSGGYEILLLEQTNRSVPYNTYVPKGPVCLVLGNEIEGIEIGLVRECDAAIDIPMHGIKNSLNVTVAFGIAAFYLRQHLTRLCKENAEYRRAAAG